jgi:hypothetical protein
VTEPEQPRGIAWLGAIKGLTISNVLVIALLAVVAVPVYVVYKALSDDKLMDRLMSTYEVIGTKQGCAVRHVQERGGPGLWGVSSGFAFQGADKWFVNVMLDHAPTDDEIAAYCESLKLIADRMLERGSTIHQGPMPGAATDGSGHQGDLPPAAEKTE